VSTVRFVYSLDRENYDGDFETREAALAAGRVDADDAGATVWTGEASDPCQPEDCIDGNDLIEAVCNHEDYLLEFAEDWGRCTKGQLDELTAKVREVFRKWLNRHKLRPHWFLVDEATVQEHKGPGARGEEQQQDAAATGKEGA
jgi:hypothetical protein